MITVRSLSHILRYTLVAAFWFAFEPSAIAQSNNVADSQKTPPSQGRQILDTSGNWKSFQAAVQFTNADLELASTLLGKIYLESSQHTKFSPDQLKAILQALLLHSSVSTISENPKIVFLYNSLADVFMLVSFDSDNHLEHFGLVSGRALTKTLEMQDANDVLSTLLVQRIALHRDVREALLKAEREGRDFSSIFKQYMFDQSERDYLGAALYRMVTDMSRTGESKCTTTAAEEMKTLISSKKMVNDVSLDIRNQYSLLMTGEEDKEGYTVFVFGDTLVNRSRAVVVIQRKSGACITRAALAQTILD